MGKYFTSFDNAKIYYHLTLKNKQSLPFAKAKRKQKWLIFLHGFGGDLTAWKKERDYFSKLGISTIAMDLRGHGLSERSNSKDFYRLENFSKDVLTLIEKEQLTNTVVIGHCFGGMVAIHFQALFPNHSKGLVLVDTSYKPPFFATNRVEKALLKQIIGLFTRFLPNIKVGGHRDFNRFLDTKDLDFKRILSDILHTSLSSYLMISNNLVGLNADKLLDQILVPTLIIEGAKDTIFPPEIAKYLHKRIKTSELDIIPEANHILVINNPKEVEKSMVGFLKKINFI